MHFIHLLSVFSFMWIHYFIFLKKIFWKGGGLKFFFSKRHLNRFFPLSPLKQLDILHLVSFHSHFQDLMSSEASYIEAYKAVYSAVIMVKLSLGSCCGNDGHLSADHPGVLWHLQFTESHARSGTCVWCRHTRGVFMLSSENRRKEKNKLQMPASDYVKHDFPPVLWSK